MEVTSKLYYNDACLTHNFWHAQSKAEYWKATTSCSDPCFSKFDFVSKINNITCCVDIGGFFFKIYITVNLRSWRVSYTVCQSDALMFAWNCIWKNNNSVLLIYYNSGYIDLSKRRVGQEDIVKCTEKFSNAKHVSTHIKLCLFKNRSVSKLHTPFTTWTEWNFSQKTPGYPQGLPSSFIEWMENITNTVL